MQVHDEYVPDETFSEFVRTMPQCCVEIVLSTPNGVLLAKRSNEPVKDEWFWPGSRLYKGERLEDAAHRVASEELGIEIEIVDNSVCTNTSGGPALKQTAQVGTR